MEDNPQQNSEDLNFSIAPLSSVVSNMEKLLKNTSKLNSLSNIAFSNSALYNLSKISKQSNPAFDTLQNIGLAYRNSLNLSDSLKNWNNNFSFATTDIVSKHFNQIEFSKKSDLFYNRKFDFSIIDKIPLSYKALNIDKQLKNSTFNLSTLSFGNAIGLNKKSQLELNDTFSNLSNYYNKLKVTEYKSDKLFDIATEELYTGANLIESISESEKIIIEKEVLKNVIQYENEYNLNSFLSKIDKDLWNMWKGAIETFKSNNPDKVRQFITSIRELFSHLFHILAPNNEITKWTQDKNNFHEGKPTRKCRLLYICRNISNVHFNDFVNSDIKATIAFIDLFQKGTHSLHNDFSEYQLTAIKSKAENTLKFLLEIEFSTNK